MKGKYKVRVQNKLVRFDFEIDRNVSIIRGNSATGKTTLINMIVDYHNLGKASGVTVNCAVNCVAMINQGSNWKAYLDSIHSSIVFIDEGEPYVRSMEFAEYISGTDNYYVIATRDNLYYIPYSVDAIYELKESGRYGKLKTVYNCFKRIYSEPAVQGMELGTNGMVITEDSRSGYQFFKAICDKKGIPCETSSGKSNVLTALKGYEGENALVVADGAAFGPEMENVYSFSKRVSAKLFLPESFEWLILNSGIVGDSDISDILAHPYDYVESEKYFSWEKYFTSLLIARTQRKAYRYDKSKIAEYYLSDKSVSKILGPFFEDM
ncbi:MAG: translation initiation factor 2 [Lachnospiraceae bacterium]|nr:translation initiation factor 2 [Lachnospiraceae bacterium]